MRDNIVIDIIIQEIQTVPAFASIISEAHELGIGRRIGPYNKYIESTYFNLLNQLDRFINYVNFSDILFDTARTEKACIIEALEELKKKGQP